MLRKILFPFLCALLCFASHISAIEETIISPTQAYTVVEKLGEGFFGKVFSVTNTSGETFALKTYRPEIQANCPEGILSYLSDPEREFTNGQRINHPNIIKSIEIFNEPSMKSSTCVVLQFVDGANAHDFPRNSLTKEESIHALTQLLETLSYLASQGYFHIDLNPGNLMLTKNMDVMIVDLASFFSLEEFQTIFYEITSSNAGKFSKDEFAKNNKLHHFFSRNPELLGKMQHLHLKHMNEFSEEGFPKIFTPILHRSFEFISDRCVDLILRSNFSSEEKIDIRMKLKKISWEYEEEIAEGVEQPFISYLERLNESIQSLL